MAHIISTRQVTVRKVLYFPPWMEHAMAGEKIKAIKCLRDSVGFHADGGYVMTLEAAKRVVEHLLTQIREETVV